jgi:hypothetical protein
LSEIVNAWVGFSSFENWASFVIRASSFISFHAINKIACGDRAPIFFIAFGRSFLLCSSDCFIHFHGCLFPPLRQRFGIGQFQISDCLKVAEQTITDLKLADAETLAEWRKEAVTKVDEAIATAQKEAPPQGDNEDWCALSTRNLVDQLEND